MCNDTLWNLEGRSLYIGSVSLYLECLPSLDAWNRTWPCCLTLPTFLSSQLAVAVHTHTHQLTADTWKINSGNTLFWAYAMSPLNEQCSNWKSSESSFMRYIPPDDTVTCWVSSYLKKQLSVWSVSYHSGIRALLKGRQQFSSEQVGA